MNRLRLPISLLLLLAFSLAPQAQDADTGLPATEDYSFLIFYMGSNIGWVKTTVRQVELDGRTVRHEHEVGYVQIKRSFDGATFETNSVTDYWYELDGRFIREVDVTKNGDQEKKVEVVFAKDSAEVTETVDGGKPLKSKLEYGDKTVYGDFRAWHVLKDAKLEKGRQLKFWTVEEDELILLEQTWTVGGRVKRKLSDKTLVEGTEVSLVKGGRAATVIFGDDDMPLLFEDVGGFTLERVKEIPDPFKPEAITLRNVMKANIAILDDSNLTQLDIHFKFEHDDTEGVEPIAETNAYHEVIQYDEGYALRLKSQKLTRDFDAPAYPLTDVPDDVSKYLAATAMCQCDDEKLAGEAAKLAKGKTNSVSLARAIMRFADKRLEDSSGSTGSASARQAYDECTGDCTEHAALFVALARAAGLPARNIGGFVYVCSDRGDVSVFGYHAWAEVWLGQWVPVDPTVGELGTSARYVMFQIDEPGEPAGRSRSSRCIRQDIKPIIDAYELADGTSWRRKGAKEFEWK
ncbi:MAG: transglutaminase-like domain-containing protein [Planctomycetes bacterium]|nr:transglutaminase-like domain-containing protein [Planctomycetota bacterium]